MAKEEREDVCERVVNVKENGDELSPIFVVGQNAEPRARANDETELRTAIQRASNEVKCGTEKPLSENGARARQHNDKVVLIMRTQGCQTYGVGKAL